MEQNENLQWDIFNTWIENNYFKRNFGVLTKSEFELQLFELYLKANSTQSDFQIGKSLGLTESRVRNLRQKVYIRFEEEDESWKIKFLDLMPKAKYDENKKLMKLTVRDVNLLDEIKNFLEENDYYWEGQLNSKLLQCPPEYFFDIGYMLSNESVINPEAVINLEESLKQKISQLAIDEEPKNKLTEKLNTLTKNVSKELAVDFVKFALKIGAVYILQQLFHSGVFEGELLNIVSTILTSQGVTVNQS